MDINSIPNPSLEEVFRIEAKVNKPIVVGQDGIKGRRQLIEITGGTVSGCFSGYLLPGGVDSQIIRPDGFVELTARYGIKLDSGETFYIDNSGVRRVDPEYAAEVSQGKIVDPSHVYFATVAKFETYSENLKWLERSIFISYSARLPESVLLRFYRIV
jgi:hypothetical protein